MTSPVVRLCSWVSLGSSVLVAGCASSQVATPRQVADRVEQDTGYPTREALAEPDFPPGVSTADGLTEEEAVATALWNNPSFQESLADLGIARADVAQAGLLRNPVLSLLFPWGPKQLEATAKWPIDAIWQRPGRIAAARASAEVIAERLVAGALHLAAETKLAYAELVRARNFDQLTADTARLSRRIAELARSRLDAGDISELEEDAIATDAARADLDARRATLDVALAENRLQQLMGLADASPSRSVPMADDRAPTAASCMDVPATDLERAALAARPDLRAVELEIEAGGKRLGWERSRTFSFLAVLDLNSLGKEGVEVGPGLETDFGLFDRNQPGVMRATADLDRARARYQTTRLAILRDLRDARAALQTSSAAADEWRQQLRPRLERQAAQTERAYEAGEMSYLAVIEALRRLNLGRISELDAAAAMKRSIISGRRDRRAPRHDDRCDGAGGRHARGGRQPHRGSRRSTR